MGRAPQPRFRPELEQALARRLSGDARVVGRRMFGFPSFAVGKKMFACVYGEGIALKLPDDVVTQRTGQAGCCAFRPYDMAIMRQWLHLCIEPGQLAEFEELVEMSIAFVALGEDQRGTSSRAARQKRTAGPTRKAVPKRPAAKRRTAGRGAARGTNRRGKA